jgi:hypothetical protein
MKVKPCKEIIHTPFVEAISNGLKELAEHRAPQNSLKFRQFRVQVQKRINQVREIFPSTQSLVSVEMQTEYKKVPLDV